MKNNTAYTFPSQEVDRVIRGFGKKPSEQAKRELMTILQKDKQRDVKMQQIKEKMQSCGQSQNKSR